jgi:hypothetical protein
MAAKAHRNTGLNPIMACVLDRTMRCTPMHRVPIDAKATPEGGFLQGPVPR